MLVFSSLPEAGYGRLKSSPLGGNHRAKDEFWDNPLLIVLAAAAHGSGAEAVTVCLHCACVSGEGAA